MSAAASAPESMDAAGLAALIDISAVQAFHTEQDVRALAGIATENRFIAAHALPHFVPLLRSLIPAGSFTMVGGPVGFPSGGHATRTKIAEARTLVADGAQELDMMMNIGRLKSGDTAYVADEIRAVADAIAQQLTVEVLDARLGVGEHVCRALLTADLARHIVGRLGLDARSATTASSKNGVRAA